MPLSDRNLKQLNNFLSEHSDLMETEEGIAKVIEMYNAQVLANPPVQLTEDNAVTSDDFMELAENASTLSEKVKYAKKALKADPECIDARVILVINNCLNNEEKLIRELQKIIKDGWNILEKQGFTDEESIGHFWGITETRPYMRANATLADVYIRYEKYMKAAEIYEAMIHLNSSDNQGVRFPLICIYALYEMEEKALALAEQFGDYPETITQCALSIMYYKMADYSKAKKYLRDMMRTNKDTSKFIKAVVRGNLDQYSYSSFGYRPFTMEELITLYSENDFLFSNADSYFMWAYKL